MTLRTDDLVIPQGTTYRVQWPLRNEDGTPFLAAGYTARAQARKRLTDADTLAEWTTEDGGIVLTDSSLTLGVDPAESTAWTWVKAVYDIEVESSTGSVTRITQGNITVDREVTR